MKRIFITDTTLRDGEQTPGVQLSTARKLEIARQLDRFRVDCIEAGFPASSKGDFRAVEEIAGICEYSAVSALARADIADVEAAAAAVSRAKNPRIHVFIATSDLHIKSKLKSTRADVLARVKTAVSRAAELCPTVEFSGEDSTRSDEDFLLEVLKTAADCGAEIINIPDTVGYTLPSEFISLVGRVKRELTEPRKLLLSVHCHDDLGLATANSVAALAAGADCVECTVNGIGERAGNASLEEIAMAIRTRWDSLGLETGLDIGEIMRTSRLVSSVTGLSVSPGKAIVGANAFLHGAGIHQHGVMCDPSTYEIINPADIGLSERNMVLGKLSGKHAFRARVTELGYKLSEEALTEAFRHFKEVADRKREITDEDIAAIVNEQMDSVEGRYRLAGFQIQSGSNVRSMAMITISERENPESEISRAALGEGPVDAAFNAIKEALGVSGAVLESYGITAVTEGTDALGEAKVRVRSSAGVAYTGRSVSSDVIKSSIKAYLAAMNKLISSETDREAY